MRTRKSRRAVRAPRPGTRISPEPAQDPRGTGPRPPRITARRRFHPTPPRVIPVARSRGAVLDSLPEEVAAPDESGSGAEDTVVRDVDEEPEVGAQGPPSDDDEPIATSGQGGSARRVPLDLRHPA